MIKFTHKHIAFSYCDSEHIGNNVYYCKEKNLYWKNGRTYDARSAAHNGLIGIGAKLKKLIKN